MGQLRDGPKQKKRNLVRVPPSCDVFDNVNYFFLRPVFSSLSPSARSKVVVSAIVNMVLIPLSFQVGLGGQLKLVLLFSGQGVFEFDDSVSEQAGRDEEDECHWFSFVKVAITNA